MITNRRSKLTVEPTLSEYEYSVRAHDNTQAIISSYDGIATLDDVNLDVNDKHNVHNVTVVNDIHSFLEGVISDIIQMSDEIDTITRFYKRQTIDSRYKKMFHVLNYIKNADALYSPKKIPEHKILIWVFNQMKKSGENGIAELAHQIDNCYDREEGSICCLEGRICRYLQALQISGEQRFQIVPLWYYKNEIENYCARALDHEIGKMTPGQQQKYFNVSDDESGDGLSAKKWIKATNTKIVQKLDTYFRNEYLHKLGTETFQKITKDCYDAIIQL